MPKKAKKATLSEHPIPVRLPPDLFDRVQALVSQYGTQSTVLRLAVAEGLKVLERRARG